MKKTSVFLLMLMATPIAAIAQSTLVPQDTILTVVDMGEIVVKAPEIVNKGDHKTYFPTSQQKKLSTNGLSLLQQLQLTGLQVNSLFQTVSVSGGGEATFCINGRIVDIYDVTSLKPGQVARVEYIDNPGARFKNSAVVINYILKSALQGGSIMTDLMEAVNTTYGRNNVSAKYNTGKSEWSLNYNIWHASFKEFHNQKEEIYHFNEGNDFSQQEDGLLGKLKYAAQNLTVNYNYLNPNKWMVNFAIRGRYYDAPTQQLNSMLHRSDYPEESWSLKDYSKNHSHSTSADLYIQRMLPNGQNLYFDLTGTYIDTYNNLDYSILNKEDTVSNFENTVNGDKYSLIGELLYEKNYNKSKWTIGMKSQYGYTHNSYSGTILKNTLLHESDNYLYSEWQQIFSKWNYTIGMGCSLTDFKQSGEGFSRFNFRPNFRFAFSPSETFRIQYRGNMEEVLPTLSQLSDVEQVIDNYQNNKGNPNLHPATEYTNRLIFDFHKNSWSNSLNLTYRYQHHPIMEETYQSDNYFVRTFENQTCWQKFNAEYELRFRLLEGAISFRGAIGLDYLDSKGSNYHHSHCNLYGTVNTTIAGKFIALTFDLTTHRPTLSGETLYLGEDLHDIALTYYKKHYSLSLCMNNPFLNNYRVGSIGLNKEAPYKNYQYVNETSRMFLLKWTCNMDFGRKHKTEKQRLKNEDNDSGVITNKKQF